MEIKKNIIKEEISNLSQQETIDKFLSFCKDILMYVTPVSVELVTERDKLVTLASYNLNDNTVRVYSKNRALADILRSIAHELVHHKQLEDGRIDLDNPPQDIGGVIEDEANAIAGQLVKAFGYTGVNIYENYSIQKPTKKSFAVPKIKMLITKKQHKFLMESTKIKTNDKRIIDSKIPEDSLKIYDGMGKGRIDKKQQVTDMQQNLVNLNYVLPRFGVDGKFGNETLKAVNAFQKDYGFEESDLVTPEVLDSMKNKKNINKNPQINDPKQIKIQAKKGNIKPFSPGVIDAIKKASKEHGLSEELMFTIANIESGGNPTATNKKSGASGLYQIMPKYFSDYGVDGTTVWDPYENANAAGKKLKEKVSSIFNSLGFKPSDAQLYMSHNQGTTGFKVIYNACEKFGNLEGKESLQQSANDLGYSRRFGAKIYRNMKGNKGNHPCQFMDWWTNKYESKKVSY